MFKYFILTVLLTISTALPAGEVDVVGVKIVAVDGTHFRIDASLQHADTGWQHYADAWEVIDENGTLLGTRVLHHPHVREQPFTRSLTLEIPAGVTTVTIRAHDSVHGYVGKTLDIAVPR